MELRSNNEKMASSKFELPTCDCCEGTHDERKMPRREFFATAGGPVLGATALGSVLPAGRLWAKPKVATAVAAAVGESAAKSSPESMVKVLFDMLSPKQREKICFPWDHQSPKLGLLRTRIAANWNITEPFIADSDFYTDDQQAVIRKIFEGIISPEWHKRIDKQLDDDAAGYGVQNSIAIFGEPGSDKSEFVMTGRHMTIRCDGNAADHVAFGGPIFYGHAADGFNEGPQHKGNVFWPQAQAANKLYQMMDRHQQEQALVEKGLPPESRVGFQGKNGKFQGLAVTVLPNDQREHLKKVMAMLMEPYRQSDRDEVTKCLKAQGGLDACHLAYFKQQDIGNDGVWDIWRIEGPSFVWHYRGAPHVHVWVNVADDPNVKLNA